MKTTNLLYIYLILLIGIVIGLLVGSMFSRDHYDKKYIKLRSEIRLITDVDISYPYGDDRLNKSWFGEEKEERWKSLDSIFMFLVV